MRRLTIGCVLAMLATPVVAEGARQWMFDDNPEMPALRYGTPDSDDMLFAVTCEPTAKRMTVVEAVSSKTMSPGGAATFKLSAGSSKLELTGDAVASESDGTVSIEVNGAPNARLFTLLKAGPSLTIEVSGGKETIPLANASAHVATLEKLCLGRK